MKEKTIGLEFQWDPRKGKEKKHATADRHDPEMLNEYDFTDGVKGKYVQRYYESTNLVQLDEDIVKRKSVEF